MSDQTVAQDTKAGAKPPVDGSSAQDTKSSKEALADLLKDFDDEPDAGGNGTDTTSGQSTGVEAELAAVKKELRELRGDAVERATKEAIAEIKGSELSHVSDKLARGFIEESLREDPKLLRAWQSPKRGEVAKYLRNELKKEVTPISAEATADNDALVAAVHGAKTTTPEPPKSQEQFEKEVRNMDNKELHKLKRSIDPRISQYG